MATYAQLAMAGQAASDRSAFEAAQNREDARRTKANKWGGWGRTLGLLGTGLGIAAMSNPLTGIPAAIAIGLGGLGGRSVARALGGGRERDADKNIDALFYQGKQREFAKEIGTYQEGVRERMLTGAGTDALSAFMFAKYAKPAMGKLKGKFLGRFGSPEQKLAMMTGDPGAADIIARAKGASEYLASPEAGMFGEASFSKADPSTWGSRFMPQESLGPTPDLPSFAPSDLTGITNPLGAPDMSTAMQGPTSDTYDAGMAKAAGMRTMDHAGRITNPEVLKSLGGLPAQPPQDFLGGMSIDQYTNLSDEDFWSFMNQGQGQQGNLLNMTQNQSSIPSRLTPQYY
jgi:hypothetical protein